MQTVESALKLVAEAASALVPRVERVPLERALGRSLAAEVLMDHDVPPFDRALMDGYALQPDDREVGRELALVGIRYAGDASAHTVGAGQCVAVMTGAPLPEGAGCVLPLEWVEEVEGGVVIRQLESDDAFVASRASHVPSGSVVLAEGARIRPAHLGVLASAGCSEVTVYARPSVCVLGTGSELVPVSERPDAAQIRNSNGPALLGQIADAGGVGRDLGIAPDDEASLRTAVEEGLSADVLLLSGGVSKGVKDLVPGVLARAGVTEVFHRWAVQPGGPLWFGRTETALVFGLPGNPQATFVGFEVLVRPVLERLQGRPFRSRPTLRAHYDGPWGRPLARRRLRPVTLACDAQAVLHARALPWKGSGDPFGLAAAEGLAILPEHKERLEVGSRVDVIVLRPPDGTP